MLKNEWMIRNSQATGFIRKNLRIWILLLILTLSVSAGEPSISSGVNENGITDNISNVNIILITGDTVAAYNVSGKVTYSVLPDKTGINRTYQIIESPQGTYFIPIDVDLKKVDMELFNVKYLLKEGYENLSFIPVMMTLESIPNKKKGVGTQGIMGKNKRIKIDKIHKKIKVAAARLDKKDARLAFDSLLANEKISKIWLDKKRHISLSDSVPLIGSPVLWAQGYNGSGIKIAIIDSGIDAVHPDLDDLDDNPLTNDPKVLVRKNFVGWSEDNTTADLHGHGTHVASIAAGTGEASGGLYVGVAPSAYLWNLRVFTKDGSGYESWIIGAVNYSIYGADGILSTGDEADIISMSLGGGPTDGNDPMSRAVNNAIDEGIVVTISAGNCGYFCITTPGAADKIITVGATYKSDNLALFSSRGPTLDYRIKPDVVAPGVSIVAARASGTSRGSPVNSYYTSVSGTSMASPHVAGAAALILQKARDNIPGWILEQNYNSFPVSYNWIDGITGGTSGGIHGDDVVTSAIDIGFNFTYYGENYSILYFSTNGLITFDNPSATYINFPIPDPAQPNNFIAPFWDDLNVVSGTGNTYYKLDASSDQKKFIITWKDIYKLGYSNPMTFEAVLFSNGSFLFQYQNISNVGYFDQTIGAENVDGSEGVQYKYSSPVSNQSAVMFMPKTYGIGKPKYVKNVLISTAKDLNLSVYEQGGGRIQIPNATRARIIADPATVSFKITKGINTSVITFYNLDATSPRTLNLNAVVRDSSGNIVNAASLNTSSLTIAPDSVASVLLTIDSTSIPTSIYSGKLTAIADNGEKVGVIFGFTNYIPISSCTAISSPGNYVLITDIIDSTASTCIEITSNDVVFDGQGHTIDGINSAWSIGVYAHGAFNVTVKNSIVSDWDDGINYANIDSSNITDNTVSNSSSGIHLEFSSNNTVSGNNASNNSLGFSLDDSWNNTLINNIAESNSNGIFVHSSSSNTLDGNIVTSNKFNGIKMNYGSMYNTLTNNIIISNLFYGIMMDCMMSPPENNTIYNNYFNNTNNVWSSCSNGGLNYWNTTKQKATNIIEGPYIGGNYWLDYHGVDTDGDGLGDTQLPYNSSGNIIQGGDYLPLVLSTLPASITNLHNKTYEQTNINWTWTDPVDTDFDKVMVYLDGTFEKNVSKGIQYYHATGLTPDTEYTISTRTTDISGNINSTWVNHTSKTAPSDLPPTVTGNTPTGTDVPVTAQVTVTFSETMNQTSVESAFSTSPATTGIFSWSSNMMTYIPSSNLEFDTNYTVNIGTGATDLAGNPLDIPYSWGFSTEGTTPPSVTIKSPTDGITVTTSTITVSGTASDDTAVTSVTVNDNDASGSPDWSTWSADVNLTEGTNTITAVATDNAGNQNTTTITIYKNNVVSYNLNSGWNLISIPLLQADTSIASVLSPINGNYSIVWGYNASDTVDHWKKYDPDAPFGNDLTTMEPGKGYWIMMNTQDELPISGTLLESMNMGLKSGWNLIGYNRLDTQSIVNALSSINKNYSIVWAYNASDNIDHWKKYDPGAPFGNDLVNMEHGNGYWIMMSVDDVLIN